jgi:thiol-disulfide isomerase/thioredoxin
VRSFVRVGLAAACLGLAGCSLFAPKKDGPGTAGADPRPWPPVAKNTPLAPAAARDPDPGAPPAEADNLLAGQVVDRAFNKRRGKASIQVVDLDENNATPTAKVDFSADEDGYFFIPGLLRGHHYRLVARLEEGNRILSGTTLATPPNPRLSIFVSEDLTAPGTPPPLGRPTVPGPAKPGDKPAAGLDPPKGKPEVSVGTAPDAPPPNKSKIATKGADTDAGGFEKYTPDPTVNIPGGPPARPVIPPPPPAAPLPPPAAPPPADAGGPAAQAPPRRTAPPYCVLLGDKLDDFALTDWGGKPWRFRGDAPRKLVLVDFWKTNCPPCLAAVPHLVALQEKYGGDGLEVVGVAYEDPAPLENQEMNVRAVRLRYNINYTILRGADAVTAKCPVREQFLVEKFPRMVLIDGNGDVLWRSSPDGLDAAQLGELEREIYRKLHPPTK